MDEESLRLGKDAVKKAQSLDDDLNFYLEKWKKSYPSYTGSEGRFIALEATRNYHLQLIYGMQKRDEPFSSVTFALTKSKQTGFNIDLSKDQLG
jgi:hypothetical protein